MASAALHAPPSRAQTLCWRPNHHPNRCRQQRQDQKPGAALERRRGGGAAMAAQQQAAEPSATEQQPERRVVQLKAVDITAENFKPFGQLIEPHDDGKLFGSQDAQLELDKGQPRFYIMRLPRRGRTFDRITYHAEVTQCLGGLQPVSPWFLVVARPTLTMERQREEDLVAFRIPHGVFVKLHKGTWHAGPLFDGPSYDFYNLELSDTNIEDSNVYDYGQLDGMAFEVVD